MDDWLQDLRSAGRRLRTTAAFTFFSVVTLALGIGVTAAIYAVVRAFFAPPGGVQDVNTLVNISHSPGGGSVPTIALSWPDYRDLKSQQTTFAHLTAWRFFRQALTANGHAETAWGELVDGDYFAVLGVNAQIGRTLQPADDQVGSPPVAVISHQVWQRVFQGVPDIVGRVIRMNGHSFEVVGVAPAVFRGLFNGGFVPSAVWVPLASVALLPPEGMGYSLDPGDRENRWLLVTGRLAPNESLSAAAAQTTAIARRLDVIYPIGAGTSPRSLWATSRRWTVQSAADVVINESVNRIVRPLAVTLMTALGLVLLIACTNLANLMLARDAGRRHELAIRLALGASRWRLAREALSESVILAVTGGVLSLVLTRGLIAALGRDLAVGRGTVLHIEPVLDGFVLTVSACATLLALVVAGVGPVVQSTRVALRSAIGSGNAGIPLPRWRGRRALIAAQVAVSFGLLALAALSVAQVRQGARHDSGLDLGRLALLQVDFGLQGYDPTRVRQIVAAVLTQIQRQSTVEAVAASSGLPVGVSTPGGSVRTQDGAAIAPVELLASTPGIFDVLGVAISRGRALGPDDVIGAAPAIVVSEGVAKTLFGTLDVVGRPAIFKRAHWAGMPEPSDEPVTIVGVAANTNTGSVGRREIGSACLPLEQHYEGKLVLLAQSTGDPQPLVGALRCALHSVDPTIAVTEAGTGLSVAGPAHLFLQITAYLAGLLGSFALLLALAGLYGALSHIVTRRTSEIGVRLALGASRQQIIRMVLVDGLRPVLYGLALGLGVAFLARLAAQPFFVRLLPAFDPFVLAVAPLSMFLVALLACYLPATRAARVDPNVALRQL